jgi:hypothetical protein
VNIEPDVDCLHCGMVITCPHTPAVPYPPHCINTPPPPLDIEYTDNFIENMRRSKARKAADAAREIPTELYEYYGHTPPGAATTSRPRPAAIAKPGTHPAYVAAAIRNELTKLAAAREGTRNATLAPVACAVFEFVKAGHAEKAAAWDELERIALAIGLEPSEIKSSLTHQWKKVGPRDVPAPGMPARVVEVQAAELMPRGAA